MVKFNHLDFYRNDVFSQNGEDGVISELLKRLGLNNNLEVVEFGACDGIYLSNTFNLIKKNLVKKAIYIEHNKKFFEKLKKNAEINSCITALNISVEKDKNSKNSLENILNNTNINKDVDILSIDIDSYDLEVFLSLEKYQPKILIIEVNRMEVGIFHRHTKEIPGNSFSETVLQIRKKGFCPIIYTGNLIFINNKYLHKVGLSKKIIKNADLLYNYHNFFYKYKSISILRKFLMTIIPLYILNYLYKLKKNYFFKNNISV